jgi:hypothetical protein
MGNPSVLAVTVATKVPPLNRVGSTRNQGSRLCSMP